MSACRRWCPDSDSNGEAADSESARYARFPSAGPCVVRSPGHDPGCLAAAVLETAESADSARSAMIGARGPGRTGTPSALSRGPSPVGLLARSVGTDGGPRSLMVYGPPGSRPGASAKFRHVGIDWTRVSDSHRRGACRPSALQAAAFDARPTRAVLVAVAGACPAPSVTSAACELIHHLATHYLVHLAGVEPAPPRFQRGASTGLA